MVQERANLLPMLTADLGIIHMALILQPFRELEVRGHKVFTQISKEGLRSQAMCDRARNPADST
jgi:hypothetical protein